MIFRHSNAFLWHPHWISSSLPNENWFHAVIPYVHRLLLISECTSDFVRLFRVDASIVWASQILFWIFSVIFVHMIPIHPHNVRTVFLLFSPMKRQIVACIRDLMSFSRHPCLHLCFLSLMCVACSNAFAPMKAHRNTCFFVYVSIQKWMCIVQCILFSFSLCGFSFSDRSAWHRNVDGDCQEVCEYHTTRVFDVHCMMIVSWFTHRKRIRFSSKKFKKFENKTICVVRNLWCPNAFLLPSRTVIPLKKQW